jgi:hypothetical protein
MDKHPILLRKFVNYGRKKFHNIGPRVYYATGPQRGWYCMFLRRQNIVQNGTYHNDNLQNMNVSQFSKCRLA